MFGGKIGVYITLVLLCCAPVVVSANPCGYTSIHPANSYVDAIGFLSGQMSNLTYGHDDFGDFIAFHAKHMLLLALAFPIGCSIIWLYLNKDVHIHLESAPSGYIGNHSLHIVFKTIVSGPI